MALCQYSVHCFYVIKRVLVSVSFSNSVSALIGSVFSNNQEPAYANLRMFQALGFTIAYVYSKFLCEYIKLYIAAGFVVMAVILQSVVEIRVKRSDMKTLQQLKSPEPINY